MGIAPSAPPIGELNPAALGAWSSIRNRSPHERARSLPSTNRPTRTAYRCLRRLRGWHPPPRNQSQQHHLYCLPMHLAESRLLAGKDYAACCTIECNSESIAVAGGWACTKTPATRSTVLQAVPAHRTDRMVFLQPLTIFRQSLRRRGTLSRIGHNAIRHSLSPSPAPGSVYARSGLYLGIKIEKGVDAMPQLGLDLFAAAFQHMHRYMRFIAVLQCHRSFAYRRNLVRRQQPHSIHQG